MEIEIPKIQKLTKFQDAIANKKFDPSIGYTASIKEDGWNVRLFKRAGIWYPAISSSGRAIPALKWISAYLNEKRNDFSCIEDAEIYAEAHNRDIPFPIINGMLNRKYEPCENIQITIFDVVLGRTTKNQIASKYLKEIADILNESGLKIFRPATQVGTATTIADFDSIFSKYYDEEGIVFKKFGHVLAPGKRNLDLIKYKKECEIDVLCTNVFETEGEKGNKSVSITVKTKAGVEFDVVIGRQTLQNLFLMDKSNVVGKVVTISGMEILSSGKIRQPVFKYVREDKLPEDID